LIVALVVLIGAASGALAATQATLDLDPAQATRYHKLTKQLRCPVCQNESIAESNSAIAADLRQLVARHIIAGDSNARIKDYLVARYGNWILYDPPFQWSTLLLWLSPFVLLLAALTVAFVLLRGSRRGHSDTTLDKNRLDRLLDENDCVNEQEHSE
jgi:cytochrome c-type biogenesis protein CcmH